MNLTMPSELFAICESITDQPMQLRRAAYVSALRRFDWNFERNDSCRYFQCKQERQALEHERDVLDPDAAVWNANCPVEFRK